MAAVEDRRLSKRQRECWDARVDRLSAKEVGRRLEISPHTVAMHWRLARLKLEMREKGGACAAADGPPANAGQSRRKAIWDEGFRWLALLFLLFSLFSAILFGLAWLTLQYSPAFKSLREGHGEVSRSGVAKPTTVPLAESVQIADSRRPGPINTVGHGGTVTPGPV